MHYGAVTSDDANTRVSEHDFWNPLVASNAASGRAPLDFWLPFEEETESIVVSHTTTASPPASGDFWALPSEPERDDALHTTDWGTDTIELPWFDRELRDNPYIIVDGRPPSQSMAIRRGRWLAMLAYLPSPRRRRIFAGLFAEVFARFPTQNTFNALCELALAEIDADTIWSACLFRIDFLEAPQLHARRSAVNRTTYPYHDPGAMLSWRRAARIVAMCDGEDPLSLIEDVWYHEWFELKVEHPLYWAYIDYLEWRFRIRSLGYWTYTASASPHLGLDKHTCNELAKLGKFSRTGQLARGQTDVLGVPNELTSRSFRAISRSKICKSFPS